MITIYGKTHGFRYVSTLLLYMTLGAIVQCSCHRGGECVTDNKTNPISTGWKCPIEILPGRSIGPIELGMSREDLEKMGGWSQIGRIKNLLATDNGGKYRAYLGWNNDKGQYDKVIGVSIEADKAPNGCLKSKGKNIPGKKESIRDRYIEDPDRHDETESYRDYQKLLSGYFNGCDMGRPQYNSDGTLKKELDKTYKIGGPTPCVCEDGGIKIDVILSRSLGVTILVGREWKP